MTRFPILLLSILLSLASLSLLDFERALVLRVEGMMALSPTTKSYTYLGDGWFEFTEEDGLTWQRNFGDTRTMGGLKPKKIISIDLRLVDTTGFESMFEELGVVHIGNSSTPPIGSHLGSDGLAELTGQYYQQGVGDNPWMTKQIPGTYDFENFQMIQERYKMFGVADMDQNGLQELVGDSLGNIMTFEPRVSGERNLRRKHYWYGRTGSAQVPRIADMDNDGHPEVIISQFGDGFDGTRIVKFKPDSQKLERVFQIRYPNNPGHRGYYAVGDFDMDRRMEFANANYAGEVYFVEHLEGDTSYAISFSDTTRYINAFFHTEGSDLDGDGRPECFIGSEGEGGLSNIAVYETTGDNHFEVSLWIELFPFGGFSWPHIWAGDVTGDGSQELIVSALNTIVVLKAFGEDDYSVLWYKRFSSSLSFRLYDIDFDGEQEIIMSFVESGIHKTRILSFAKALDSVLPVWVPEAMTMSILPNPSSGDCTIWLKAETWETVELNVFTTSGICILKKELIVDSEKESYVPLSLKQVPPGIYIIRAITKRFMITRKLAVIR